MSPPSFVDAVGISLSRLSWRLHLASAFTGQATLANVSFRIPVQNGNGLPMLEFEESEHRFVGLIRSQLSARPGIVIDVGVNLGRFLLYTRAADRERGYIGFEVNTTCAHYVDQLIALNEFRDAVVFPIGLSDHSGVTTLQSASDTDTSASTVAEFYSPGRFTQTKVVYLERGDPILDASGAASVALIKIDVEGAELDVVRGLSNTIKRDRPALVIEVAPYAHKEPPVASFRRARIADLEQTLRALGYTRFSRIVGGDRLENVPTLDPGASTDIHEMDYLCLSESETVR